MAVAVWVCAGAILLLLPPAIAWRRDVPGSGAILATSLMAGWTVLGWIFALLWACLAPSRARAEAERQAFRDLTRPRAAPRPTPPQPAQAAAEPRSAYAKPGVAA